MVLSVVSVVGIVAERVLAPQFLRNLIQHSIQRIVLSTQHVFRKQIGTASAVLSEKVQHIHIDAVAVSRAEVSTVR
jgi:hypothetical protein